MRTRSLSATAALRRTITRVGSQTFGGHSLRSSVFQASGFT